jgi:hypothetical protein
MLLDECRARLIAVIFRTLAYFLDPVSGNNLKEWRQRMEVIYTTFIANHSEYQQLRFIQATGDQLVRAQRTVNDGVSVCR